MQSAFLLCATCRIGRQCQGNVKPFIVCADIVHGFVASEKRLYVSCIHAGLVDSVKAGGGEALVFSSMHMTGSQLEQLSGLAAILRFPLHELEDMELPNDV